MGQKFPFSLTFVRFLFSTTTIFLDFLDTFDEFDVVGFRNSRERETKNFSCAKEMKANYCFSIIAIAIKCFFVENKRNCKIFGFCILIIEEGKERCCRHMRKKKKKSFKFQILIFVINEISIKLFIPSSI